MGGNFIKYFIDFRKNGIIIIFGNLLTYLYLHMEIFLVICLVIIILSLWGISSVLVNIQNTLFNIDCNLERLDERSDPDRNFEDN